MEEPPIMPESPINPAATPVGSDSDLTSPASTSPEPTPVAEPEPTSTSSELSLEPTTPEPMPEPISSGDKPIKKSKKSEKTDKPAHKKSRLVVIIVSIVASLATIGALLYFLVFRKVEPVVVLTDRDILASHAWEKQSSPTVIWTFHADGTGELTTNKSNYYKIEWSLEQGEDSQILKIDTAWLYELNDSFDFSLDRENDSFTVKNLADGTESVFVPLGTSEKETEGKTEDNNE